MRFNNNNTSVGVGNLHWNIWAAKVFFSGNIWSWNIKMTKKQLRKDADRSYYVKNRTKILEKQKAYRLRNKKKISSYQKIKQQEYKLARTKKWLHYFLFFLLLFFYWFYWLYWVQCLATANCSRRCLWLYSYVFSLFCWFKFTLFCCLKLRNKKTQASACLGFILFGGKISTYENFGGTR